jgi:hypothetical protein
MEGVPEGTAEGPAEGPAEGWIVIFTEPFFGEFVALGSLFFFFFFFKTLPCSALTVDWNKQIGEEERNELVRMSGRWVSKWGQAAATRLTSSSRSAGENKKKNGRCD